MTAHLEQDRSQSAATDIVAIYSQICQYPLCRLFVSYILTSASGHFMRLLSVGRHLASLLYAAASYSAFTFSHAGPPIMLDLIVAVLGTGGILLMAAYAALCDRI